MTDTLTCGAARVDITPGYEVDLSGFAGRQNPAIGVLDPIHARAAVFDNGACRVVVVSLDILELTRADADAFRLLAAQQARTRPEHVCIACTHTHAAPATYPLKECGTVSWRFVDDLRAHIGQVVNAAAGQVRPVRFAWATAPLDIGANRRGHTEADRTLRVLAATDDAGRCVCAILHYACHGVCLTGGNRLISGDWPGGMCSRLEQALGADSVAMFMNGCAGDIAPRSDHMGSEAGLQVAVARASDAATTAWARLQVTAGTGLSAGARIVALPYVCPGPGGETAMPVCLQHLTLGPVEIVALSGEVLFGIGQGIQDHSGRNDLWVAAYCNGGHGYICTDQALAEGGYEPDGSNYYYDRPALAAGAERTLIEAGIRWPDGLPRSARAEDLTPRAGTLRLKRNP